jgi:protein gp37
MGKDTSISWTDASLNLGWGCRKVDSACANCYMFRQSKLWKINPEEIRTFDLAKREKELNSWPLSKKLIFVNDMTDTFGEFYSFDLIEEWHRFFEKHPEREFQLLTKRIGRAMVFYNSRPVPRNVWVGCSIGEKKRLWRLDQLRQIDAKVRFVSFEPLIEDPGDFDLKGIHWAIVGGESDRSNPRLMKPDWAENIRRICERNGVALWFKQMGGRGGDNAGGDLLNGKRYRSFPEAKVSQCPHLLDSQAAKWIEDR